MPVRKRRWGKAFIGCEFRPSFPFSALHELLSFSPLFLFRDPPLTSLPLVRAVELSAGG